MTKAAKRTVVFIGPNAVRTASQFNSSADKMGMPYKALAVDEAPIDAVRVIDLREQTEAPTDTATHEYWPSDDSPERSEREVMALIARLMSGAVRTGPPPEPKVKPKPVVTLSVGRETKGRGGKGVTLVWDLPGGESALNDLCKKLKEKLGVGGAVKNGKIEIQGDSRDRVCAELEKLGFKIKRVGG